MAPLPRNADKDFLPGFLDCAVCEARGYKTEFRECAPYSGSDVAGEVIWKLRHWHRQIATEMYIDYERQQWKKGE